jgi:small subunit ribosomal protein S6
MAFYETVFILRQDLTTTQVEESLKSFKGIIESGKGKVLKEENWGLRPLAYKISKNRKGHYLLVESDAPSEAIVELERKLGLSENVLRFMTVRIDAPTKDQSAILKDKDVRDVRDARDVREAGNGIRG